MISKNYMGHDLDTIVEDIDKKGYSELLEVYIINFYTDMNIKKYFEEHNLKFVVRNNMYIFTAL